jgi:tRNA(fMet)-specific endonuclease VapC
VDNILRPFAIAWPDLTAVEDYVDIRSTLETSGTRISQPDLWIAAITRAAGGILVTHHSQEFSRVPGLMLEDWLQ